MSWHVLSTAAACVPVMDLATFLTHTNEQQFKQVSTMTTRLVKGQLHRFLHSYHGICTRPLYKHKQQPNTHDGHMIYPGNTH